MPRLIYVLVAEVKDAKADLCISCRRQEDTENLLVSYKSSIVLLAGVIYNIVLKIRKQTT